MITTTPYVAGAGQSLRLPLQVCMFLLAFSIVFQKFAVPGTGGVVEFTLALTSGVVVLLIMNGVLRVNSAAFLAAIAFFSATAVSMSLSQSPQRSFPSWMFLIVVQLPFVLRLEADRDLYRQLLRYTSLLGAFAACCGVFQALVQGRVSSDAAFWLDFHIPAAVAMKGYNNLNQFAWDVAGFKSNGIFFSEPSIFSQFLGIAVLAELATAGRPLRLAMLAAGILTSYSGTGLMILGVFLVYYVPKAQRIAFVIAIVVLLALAVVAGDLLQLQFITSRVSEFTTPNTSGYARFVSHFGLIDEVLSKDVATLLFGRGPGTISEFYTTRTYEICPPTYAKVIYEFGAIGFVLYVTFFYFAVLRRGALLAWPIAFAYFVLGGYLQHASFVLLLLVLGGWWKQEPDGAPVRVPASER